MMTKASPSDARSQSRDARLGDIDGTRRNAGTQQPGTRDVHDLDAQPAFSKKPLSSA